MSEKEKGPSKVITLEGTDDILRKDLADFRQKALEWGATMSEIIPADWAEIDERVRLKCSIPLCPYYNNCLYCPPHTPTPEIMRTALSRYDYALISALEVIPIQHFAGNSKERSGAADWARKSFEITGRIETLAFGHGYHLAMGFAQASCLKALCGQERCLVLEGEKCPFPLKSRPSMEAVGIDVYRLVTRVGWDIYPVYRSVNCEEVNRALSVNIVFIA